MKLVRVNFDKPNYELARFAAVSAIGRSVRANLRKLFQATHYKTTPNWSGIVDAISSLIDRFLAASGGSLDPTAQIQIGKTGVMGLAQSYENVNPELQTVLTELANGIEPFGRGQLEAHLQGLYKSASDLGRKCVEQWGGELVRKLLKAPSQTKLTFSAAADGVGPTFAYTDKDQDDVTVTLVVGNGEGLLNSYLSLEFYFFHEYLSHVLPQWDDLSGRFSEGYLFALQRKFFQLNSHVLKDGFSLHSRIVATDMAAHRIRTGKQNSSHEDVEGLYAWLDDHCVPGVFAGLLLELCAVRSRDGRFEQKFLTVVDILADQQDPDLAKLLGAGGKDPRAAFSKVSPRIGQPDI